MTAQEAYGADDVFRALVGEWVIRRRCPLPLVDRCLDFDLTAAAECARWAATERDRSPFWSWDVNTPPDRTEIGPYPMLCHDGTWSWIRDTQTYAASVARERLSVLTEWHKTPCGAILWLLDNWVPEGVPA